MSTESRSTLDEYIPGMREQGKGIKIYVEHDFAPLKAAIVGNPGSCYMPDLSLPDFENMLCDSKSEEELAYLRKGGWAAYAGRGSRDLRQVRGGIQRAGGGFA